MLSGREVSLGKIFGIEITLDYSWFWIFLLVTWSFALGIFPNLAPGRSILTYLGLGLFGSLLLFTSVILHEISHTLVARRNNLPIEKITLFLFGGASRLTGEPPNALTELKMALAGPAASLVLGGLFLAIGFLSSGLNPPASFSVLVQTIAVINIALAVFNLLPGYPLDGGRVLRAVIWRYTRDLKKATRYAATGGRVVGWGLILFGVIQLFTSNVGGGLWMILIGFFLNQAAGNSYQQTLAFLALRDTPVARIMKEDFVPIGGRSSLNELALRAQEERQDVFAVVQDGKIIGTISTRVLRSIPRDQWNKEIQQYMRPLEKKWVVGPETPADKAISILIEESKIGILPVVTDNKVVGLIGLRDISYYLSLHGLEG